MSAKVLLALFVTVVVLTVASVSSAPVKTLFKQLLPKSKFVKKINRILEQQLTAHINHRIVAKSFKYFTNGHVYKVTGKLITNNGREIFCKFRIDIFSGNIIKSTC